MKWLWQILWGIFSAAVVILGYLYLMMYLFD
jgi:hypothetical protein